MRLKIIKLIESIRSSYWFIPSVMALIALALGPVMVWVDAGPGSDWLGGIDWYQTVKPDGAHEVLSTIAGSMITVAGVVFSITIVALAFAAGQYGPRVLTNFMADRGNQVTLGTFIATFVYCLVVLRTIRGGDEEFVPQIAVMVGLLFALCSIAVLIYYIHHVPQSIHVNEIVARIGRHLLRAVDERFPAFIGDPAEGAQPSDSSSSAVAALTADNEADRRSVAAIRSRSTGYVQAISESALMEAAREHDLVVRLRYRPGDYIMAGRIFAEAWPATRLDEEADERLSGSFTTGSKRTPAGDMLFMVDELAEITARALSTGINDPFTAMSCLDWLGAGASELAKRRLADERRADADGVVRVIGRPITFEDFVAHAFGQVRQYVARDMNAALHALRVMGEVAAACPRRAQLDLLAAEAERLSALACESLSASCRDSVAARAAELKQLLAAGPGAIEARRPGWLGGSAAA